MDDSVNSMIAKNIEENLGKISRTTGKKHTFLGMYIDFNVQKKVALDTPHNIGEAL